MDIFSIFYKFSNFFSKNNINEVFRHKKPLFAMHSLRSIFSVFDHVTREISIYYIIYVGWMYFPTFPRVVSIAISCRWIAYRKTLPIHQARINAASIADGTASPGPRVPRAHLYLNPGRSVVVASRTLVQGTVTHRPLRPPRLLATTAYYRLLIIIG